MPSLCSIAEIISAISVLLSALEFYGFTVWSAERNMDDQIESKLMCKVCGEEKFHLREGFYYCDECGTKQDQVRAIEIDCERTFNDNKYASKKKLSTVKSDKPELTSWECYNYILRGLVEDLLTLGAKEELKLVALQLWAAFLKRNEIAFFNKNHAELPKLGVRFLRRDSALLYNHSQKLRKKRKRRHTNDDSSLSAESNTREWRKQKRKLDESEYSNISVSQSRDSESVSSHNNSLSSGTTRAIQLKFSSMARRQYKKIMPVKHLKKHELDSENLLTCHNLCPKIRTLHYFDHVAGHLSLKLLYTIIAIALNLTEDDIQITDLVRFINEDRLRINNVVQYFPENLATNCKQMLKETGFFMQSTKCSYKGLRDHAIVICKFMHIKLSTEKDIFQLVQRYVTELNLPSDIAVFIERLINLLPPELKTRSSCMFPPCEARAMAYIIFVLKILFGLDGHKESLISESGRKINTTIEALRGKPVFVWNEWMEYVEMRKVIVSQYNRNFCRQFNQYQSAAQLLTEITEDRERRQQEAYEFLCMEENKSHRLNESNLMNLKHIFELFSKNYNKTPEEKVEALHFPHSFTPAHSYLKCILSHLSSSGMSDLMVPKFMHTDHMQRSMQFYLQPKQLQDLFRRKGLHLKIVKAACTMKRCYVGVFRAQFDKNKVAAYKANFNISEENWMKNIPDESNLEKLDFKTTLESYGKNYILQMGIEAKMRKKHYGIVNVKATKNKDLKVLSPNISPSDFLLPLEEFNEKLENINKLQSSQLEMPNENNVQLTDNFHLRSPRRNYDNFHLFEDVSSGIESNDECELVTDQHTTQNCLGTSSNEHTFVTSNLDYWVLLGYLHTLNEVQKKVLEKKFSRSFFWLLETCAQTIGVDWSLIYEQLFVIELMFVYGIEPLMEMDGCIKFASNVQIKDINHLILLYRAIW